MPSRLTAAQLDMHRAAVAYHLAAIANLGSISEHLGGRSATTLDRIARDKHATYLRMCERVSEAVEAIRTARGRPAERRPPEEHEEDWSLYMQERRDLQEGAPRP